MENESIILFSSDDWGWKTSKYQLSIRFSQKNKVLFVSSIGFRQPTVSAQDINRIFNKLKSFFQGLRQINDNLFVLTPIIIPFKKVPFADLLNRVILKAQVKWAKAKLEMSKPYVFVFSQNWYQFVHKSSYKKLIYYCVDEQSAFQGLDKGIFEKQDQLMSQCADVIFCSAKTLVEKYKKNNSKTYHMPHGVNYELFARTVFDTNLEVAQDIRDLSKPVLGFWGHISYDWVDADLLKYLAEKRPHWSLLLIGRNSMNTEEFQEYDNIHLIGEKNFEDLPSYCRAINVGLIPFVKSSLTDNCNPLKMYEYMAAGLPVVSTNIPEVLFFNKNVCVAKNKKDFLLCCESALEFKKQEWREKTSLTMKNNTWERKVEEIYSLITDES